MMTYIVEKDSNKFIKDIKFDISFTDDIEESSFIDEEYLQILFNNYLEDFEYVVYTNKTIKIYEYYQNGFRDYDKIGDYLCIKCNSNNKFLKLTPIIEFDCDEKMDLDKYFGEPIDIPLFHTIMYNIDNKYVPLKLSLINKL